MIALKLALISLTAASPVMVEVRQDTGGFQKEMLASHNFYRYQHGAKDLIWDDGLAKSAQGWADTCNIYHEGTWAQGIGENLAWRWPFINWAAFVNSWGVERLQYNWNTPGSQDAAGHFTQLVWKQTTKVGCGWKLCNGYLYYLVCRYSPTGNDWGLGQFEANVAPQIHGSPTDVYK